MQQWFQLWAVVPYVGKQFGGWLYTELFKVQAMMTAMQNCPELQYEIYDVNGQRVQPMQYPQFPGYTM